MLVLERHKLIVAYLEQEGSARVADLARQFQVTEETIRRDLDKLEAAGRLERSHGGAVFRSGPAGETPYWWRQVAHELEKAVIAREAVGRVREGDRILLDASTTAWHMAKRLTNMRLTVVTNSIQVAVALARLDKVEVLSLGGRLARTSMSHVGPAAEKMLGAYHVDKLFLSCQGVDLAHGVSDATEAQAHLRRKMLDAADSRVLLVDHSKFGVRALAFIAPVVAFHEVITDNKTESTWLDALRDTPLGVTVAGGQEKVAHG